MVDDDEEKIASSKMIHRRAIGELEDDGDHATAMFSTTSIYQRKTMQQELA